MALDTTIPVMFEMDFVGDTLDTFNTAVTTDTGAATIPGDGAYHVVRLNNSNAADNDMAEIGGATQWRVQDAGILILEMRARINTAVTTVAFNLGFNDDQSEDSNTLPVELSTVTFTTNAATWVGVLFDTNATTDNFYAGAVDDDTDNAGMTVANATFGFPPIADRFFTVEIVLTDQGAGNMARADITVTTTDSTGKVFTKTVTLSNAVDRDAYLCWHAAVENRTTTAKVMDIDYVRIRAGRPD